MVIVFLLHAGFLKVAARVMRGVRVSWQACLGFSAILAGLAVLNRILSVNAGTFVPDGTSIVVGLAAQLGLGAWFFGTRARDLERRRLGWRRGLGMTALATGLLLTFLAMASLVILSLLPSGQI